MSANTFELITVKHPHYGTLVALQWILTVMHIQEDKDRRDVIKKLLLGRNAYYSKLAVDYNPTVKQTGVWMIGKEAFEILIKRYKYADLQFLYDLVFKDIEFPYYRSNIDGVFIIKKFDFEKCRVMHNKLSTVFEFEDVSKIVTDSELDIEENIVPQNPFQNITISTFEYNNYTIRQQIHNGQILYNIQDICYVLHYDDIKNALENFVTEGEYFQLNFEIEKQKRNAKPYYGQFYLTSIGVCDIIFHITKKDIKFNKLFIGRITR